MRTAMSGLIPGQHQRRRQADGVLRRPRARAARGGTPPSRARRARRQLAPSSAGRAPARCRSSARGRARRRSTDGAAPGRCSLSSRNSPTSAAFCMRPFSTSVIVASAAAHATGLPPNVLECAPAGQSITSSRAIVTPIGSPDAIPFAATMMSGWTPACSIGKHLPGSPDARLHFVGYRAACRASAAICGKPLDETPAAERRIRLHPESARR